LSGDATEQTPPDLPSYLFKERIVYLGMSLVPAVTELMLAELLYLQYDNPTRPIYMYINSTGVAKGAGKLGYEAEAFAIYDTMRYIKPPVYTVCVGTAFGEAAMLLAAGKAGNRAALPSATMMIRQPMQRFTQMQASDVDIYRNELRKTNGNVVSLLAKHTGHSEEKIALDISRPKYFNPYEAKEYGLIDTVLEPDNEAMRMVARSQIE
jgi:ATP-dependent Clp protease protease subunit